jgi:hypothetical protein
VTSIYGAARSLIADPERWTTGAVARNRRGAVVSAHAPDAVRWDLLGALERVGASEDDLEPLYDAAGESLAEFNDRFQHRDVLRLLEDAALAAAGSQQTAA